MAAATQPGARPLSSPGSRGGKIVVALLCAAVAVLCAPILFDQSLWLKDIVRFTYPQKFYLRERLLAGELPLWWAQEGLGRPFFALVQPGVLYPGNLLLLVLPMPLGYDVFSAAHLLVAALGMRAWLRRCDCDETAAGLGAAIFALSGYLVSLFANNGVYVFSAAWVPVVLAAATPLPVDARAARAQALRVGLLLALCLSAGDPQAVFFAGLALLAQALGRSGARLPALISLSASALLAALVGMVLLLPGAETAAIGRAGGVALEEAQHFAFHPHRLIESIWPGAFGRPYSPSWFVSPLVDEGSGHGYLPLTASSYLGLATPWLALGGLLTRRRRELAIATLGFFALVLSFGSHTPLFALFFRFVPLASTFRYPEKYLFLSTLAAAFLAARGLTALRREPERGARLGLGVLGLLAGLTLAATRFAPAVLGALVGPSLSVAPELAAAVLREQALRALAIGFVCWLPLRLAASGRVTPAHATLLLALLVGADLLVASTPLVAWTASQTYRDRSPLLDAEPISAARRAEPAPLRLYRSWELDLSRGRPMPALDRATLLPNCGVEDGLAHLDAYAVFHTPAETDLWSVLRRQPLRLMQVTATHFALLSDQQLGAGRPELLVRARYPQLGATLLEVKDAAPRVYLAERAEPASSSLAAAQAMAAADFRPGRDAIVEGGESRRALGHCTLLRFLPERIELDCESSAPSYAILAEAAFPGWRAEVNAHEAPVLRANAAMRGVPVPAGRSSLVLRYRPRSLVPGAVVSLLSLLLALGLLGRARSQAGAS